ncbi:MAG: NACHT domain-containing protein [Alphaproteobacteria bacterium]|nr:NACHT domain-containing protein [Alphaproteobacteria bacterium]MBU2168228.1 NACHT domain-containing protein [Alphaproteobacteria bacterium]
MTLPFGALTWENFERLCCRLAARSALVESAVRYGRQGQPQQGIDVFARKADGRYEVWQAKRYRSFSTAQLRKAVKAFSEGSWLTRSDKFFIAVQADLDDVVVQEEIERQAEGLKERGIALEVMGGDRLSDRLRPHQDLVLSFFGRAWLNAFYGDQADPAMTARLDGEEFARIRAQVARLYTARFSDLDQGIVATRFVGPASSHRSLALLDRYVMPDVYVRHRASDPNPGQGPVPVAPSHFDGLTEQKPAATSVLSRDELRRVSAASWLADSEHIAVVADAGAGKSTLLRCIALDLLGTQTVFPVLAARWGERLPIIVSFAKWARATAEKGGEVSLKELVAQALQPLLTEDLVSMVNRAIEEDRIVLIVDGLDEWSAEQAARLALATLLTYVEVHQIPTIVSGRPLGLRKIGTLPQSWKTAELAPLSSVQQRALAHTWFGHLGSPEREGESSAVAVWRTDRFLKELQSDRALGELAETPLLFVGLLALAVRDVALPRDRAQAFQSLIRLLLEIHPESRATAAGDVNSRFTAAASPELRQTALAALAFASRRDGGDAGYARALGGKAIREHLLASNGYTPERADAVADEMLAVNAETVGLIVEKGPGDVGFAHASLEEFLSAVHIHSWRFADLLNFVRDNVGDPRWRNVFRNLVALNTRTSEIDDIVVAIEAADVDVLGAVNRRRLLAEITFSPSAMASGTALRLAQEIFDRIEGSGPEVERTALLRLALNGLSDTALHTTIEDKVKRWAPRRVQYRQSLYRTLGAWAADSTLLDILIAGLNDEDHETSRTAAKVLANKFAGNEDVRVRLRATVAGTSNLGVTAAALEALSVGWPCDDTDALVEAARESRSPLLRAVAIQARVLAGIHDEADRKECLQMVGFHSTLDYSERSIASETLFRGWPDDDRIIVDALQALGFGPSPQDSIARDLAVTYLLGTVPGRPSVEKWILKELEREHPFVLLGGQPWDSLVKHCEANEGIRERIVTRIISGEQKYREREVWEIIARLKDTRLRDHAVELVRADSGFVRYWSLLPLVEGWSNDPIAQELFAEIIALEDDRMDMVVALLPELYADPAAARMRLIQIAQNVAKPRYDLIVEALASLGVDGSDAEAVNALLPHASAPSQTMSAPDAVFARFGSSPKVREVALRRLQEADPPIAHIASGMADEPAVQTYVSDLSRAAPQALRGVIVAACGASADRHPTLFNLLANYDHEVTFQLKVQLAIEFYRLNHANGETDQYVSRLLEEADRLGIHFQENRATAFAGLVAIHSAGSIIEGKGSEQDINLGSYYRGGVSNALCSLVIEHWDELKAALGEDFAEQRLKTLDGPAWASLAPFASSNSSARMDFIAWCEKADQIGITALGVLADVAPRSDVLRKHALKVLGSDSNERSALNIQLVAAKIIRDQFSDPTIIDMLRTRLKTYGDLSSALALAVLAPDDPAFGERTVTALKLGVEHDEWLGAVEMAARLEPSPMVVDVLHRLAERRVLPLFDQGIPLDALIDRVIRDVDLRTQLRESLEATLSPSAFCATAGVLAAAGALDTQGWALCAEILLVAQTSKTLPVIVLDITTDQMRPISHVLSDLFQTRSSL